MTLVVRAATPEDHALFARFFLSFDMPDPIPDLAWWTRFSKNACFLEEDGKAVGYGLAFKVGDDGYVMHCAVDSSARNRGVGGAVMSALGKRLRDEGCSRWNLNVKEGNAPALALYRRFGMEVEFAVSALSLPWRCVDALPSSLGVVESFESREDREVEDCLGLDRGRVSLQRDFEDRILLRVRDGAGVAGVIGFAPRFPGAALFRARSSGHARTLFDGVRSHATHDYFRLAVEADAALAEELIGVGATRLMSLVHMVGPIPRVDPLGQVP
jgi:GNAT superfamily N-acetyltransferase